MCIIPKKKLIKFNFLKNNIVNSMLYKENYIFGIFYACININFKGVKLYVYTLLKKNS